MSKRTDLQPEKVAANIVGAKPSGLTKKVASGLEKQVEELFRQSGKAVHLRAMRFIPSTKVDLGEGAFQVMANTIVEAAGPGGTSPTESFDSVVTVARDSKTGQSLEGVKIPALSRLEF